MRKQWLQWLGGGRRDDTRGEGVHNMLRVRMCAIHIDVVLDPKFSKQESLFGKFSINMGGFF